MTTGDQEDQSADTPPARTLHPVRGTVVALSGAVVPFLIMAADRHFGFSVPLGVLCLLVSATGVLDLLGAFDDAPCEGEATTTLHKLLPRLGELAASLVLFIVLTRLAVAGVLPKQMLTMAVLMPAAFLWIVVAVFRTGRELGAWQGEDALALLRRHGFWLIVIVTLLYLPTLGSYSLTDPWETHYGEVSRELLARDDWISTWWAQDGFFYSKPVFDFWIQALSFLVFGVRYMPDQMLGAAANGRFPQPEWANRIPIFFLTVLGTYLFYKALAKVFGRRAAFLGSVVLTTMPLWYLLAHQTMCDMPYVGPLVACMALLLFGFNTDPDAPAKQVAIRVGTRTLRLSAYHLLMTLVVVTVLPQILYLLSRNVTLQLVASPHGFLWHQDWFLAGSGGGNCGLPGNAPCRRLLPFDRAFQPWEAALLWSAVAGVLLWVNRNERRLQRLYFLGAWYFMALSSLAKGAPGLVIPVFVAAVFVGATRRWKDLARLELAASLLLLACVCLPWYVQMYVRHGTPFTDELLLSDMYKRAFVHVHDTNAGDDTSFRYYVWQLGYSIFPWVGFGAGGLLWAFGPEHEDKPRGQAAAFMILWFITVFGMMTITLTKYHYYIFPAVPPIAALTGVLLDQAFETPLPGGRKLAGYLAGAGVAAALLVYGAMRWFPGTIAGFTNDDKAPPPASFAVGVVLVGVGIAVAVATWRMLERRGDRLGPDNSALALAVVGVASAAAVALTGADLVKHIDGAVPGNVRLIDLISYNYARPWPATLDFNAVITGFTIVTAALSLLFVVRRWRTHAAVLLFAVAVLWGAWGVDEYMVRAAAHWGQRETILAYYRARTGPEEPFIAYQMNWKGENFYTGNRVPAFVSSGQRFKDWIADQKKKGVKTMFFTTEWGRIGSLKHELDSPKHFDVLTTERLDNKFFLARVHWD